MSLSLPETRDDWDAWRRAVREAFHLTAGPYPAAARQVPAEPQVDETVDCGRYWRKRLSIAVEPGDRLPCYLLLPKDLGSPAPAMLCLHQTTAAGKAEPAGMGDPELAYAAELADRGVVALAPDYPGFGDYEADAYALGYVSKTMKGIWNHIRAVDLLASLPEVDGARIGSIGHSLGGHNSVFAAFFDARIRVVVSSCGFNAFAHYRGGDLSGWSHDGYMPRIHSEYGADPARMPWDFPHLLAALAPCPIFVNAPLHDDNFPVAGVHACMTAAREVYELHGAADSLALATPDAGHSFPAAEREAAYAFIEQALA
jgi:dienelactone hydrolase